MTDSFAPSIPGPSPAELEVALELARELDAAAEELGRLAGSGAGVPVGGPGVAGFLGGAPGSGRSGDVGVALRAWRGPHRHTFEARIADEADTLTLTRHRLIVEADVWASWWATATNLWYERVHAREMAAHQRAVEHYETARAAHLSALAADPTGAAGVALPARPVAPTPPIPVTAPSRVSGYRPTG